MFYYIASVQRERFKILRECSKDEVTRIEQLREPIATILYRANRRIDPLTRAFKKISEINVALMKQTSEYRKEDLCDAVSTFLFQFRKYLDNWETYLKRDCSNTPERYKAFQEATHKAYDDHIEYQIIYHLRNVDQHCDSIISTISMGTADDGAIYIEAKAKCDHLLSVFDDWKPKEKKHLQEHETIDLFKYIQIAYKCIEEIHQATLNSFFSLELYENCYKIVGIANEFRDERENLQFLCQDEELTKESFERQNTTLNMHNWMVNECIHLLTLFLKNNLSVAIVLYHGDLSCDFIDDFAINLDKRDENGDVNIGQVLTLGKWKYSCYARTTDLLNDSYTAIAINHALPQTEGRTLENRVSRFVNVLVWKHCLHDEEMNDVNS